MLESIVGRDFLPRGSGDHPPLTFDMMELVLIAVFSLSGGRHSMYPACSFLLMDFVVRKFASGQAPVAHDHSQ